MKRFVLFVMLMMCVTSVRAQRWSLTPEVGATAVLRKENTVMNTYEQGWGARWKMGVGVEYQIRPAFSLKSGLYYTQRGYSSRMVAFGSLYPIESEEPDIVFSEINSKLNRHFLQIPLMANFSFRMTDDVRLNLAAGPYVAWSLGDKGRFSYMEYTPAEGENASDHYWGYGNGLVPGWSGSGFTNDEWLHDDSFDWGVSLQVGLEMRQWVMNVGYDVALGKEYEMDSAGLKYHTLSLSVGYKFRLGK